MNRPPDRGAPTMKEIGWPIHRLDDVLDAAMEACGRHQAATLAPPSAPPAAADLDRDIEQRAPRHGFESERLFSSLPELPGLLSGRDPLLIHLPRSEEAPCDEVLLIAGANRHWVSVIDPQRQRRRIATSEVLRRVRAPFERAARADAERAVAALRLPGRSLQRMIDDRLDDVRFRGCWVLRLPPGDRVGHSLRAAGVPRHASLFVATYAGQYSLFVVSWWLLGSGLLDGTIDRAWLIAWGLLLLTVIGLRLTSTWLQGRSLTIFGTWLRRRLLRGALNVDRQVLRYKGVGQLFGLIVESGTIESLGLTGGMAAACASLELVVAATVLWLALGASLPLLLLGWVAGSAVATWGYAARYIRWSGRRIHLSERLLAAMVGHRTRLVQHEPQEHISEDAALDAYLRESQAMDRSGRWLTAVIPRGWMALAILGLAPTIAETPSTGQLAAGVGGIVLALRGLQRLAAGASALVGAAVAARRVRDLSRASETSAPVGVGTFAGQASHSASSVARETLLQVRNVTYRYQPHGEPILRHVSLDIERGARVVLEGASGSGKTTLGAIIGGLIRPDTGLVLVGGLDRASVGAAAWRSRAVMALQPHNNSLIGGSLAFNLLMGRQWPPETRDLVEADTICRQLGLGELIDRLPAGLNQVVGETGWQLSLGERTRVFLARALLQQPELLILDESFGGLDIESAEQALRCVHERGRTVLAIAHP